MVFLLKQKLKFIKKKQSKLRWESRLICKKVSKKLAVLLYQEIGEIEIFKQELVKEIFIFSVNIWHVRVVTRSPAPASCTISKVSEHSSRMEPCEDSECL